MKTILIALSILCTSNAICQSEQLSPFEEIWLVGAAFNNFEVDINGFDEPILFTPKAINNIKSFQDLNKIIADTPFLSIRLTKGSDKFEKEAKEHKGPLINLSEKSKTGKEIKGWGSFLIVFKSQGDLVSGIPAHEPEKLMKYIQDNTLLFDDRLCNYEMMTITEVRIENGTYGRKK